MKGEGREGGEGGLRERKDGERRVLAARREAHTSLAGYSHFRSYTWAEASFSFASRESKISVCVYVYSRTHVRTPKDNTVRHTRDLCSFYRRDGGGGVATMTSRCRHPTHAYAHPHTRESARSPFVLRVFVDFPET